MNLEIVLVDDKEYAIVNSAKGYCLLVNPNDGEDFLIYKEYNDELLPLESDEEFDKAMEILALN